MKNSPDIIEYLMRLADDRLILGHRLSEWCGHAPILEEDIALANIALDCIGQASHLYGVAAETMKGATTADDLVYFREAIEYKNLLLVEQPNKDFAHTIVRQFFYDAYGILLFEALQRSTFAPLAGISQKAVKEIRYHCRHSGKWIVRLGDGTEESHHKVQTAVNALWRYTDELFVSDDVEQRLTDEGIAICSDTLRKGWRTMVEDTISLATLQIPSRTTVHHHGGRMGKHTEHLGHLLSEMQIVARSYPEIKW